MHSAAIPRVGLYGGEVSPIILDDVSCGGSENNLLECHHNQINQHNCGLSNTAGVTCGGTKH